MVATHSCVQAYPIHYFNVDTLNPYYEDNSVYFSLVPFLDLSERINQITSDTFANANLTSDETKKMQAALKTTYGCDIELVYQDAKPPITEKCVSTVALLQGFRVKVAQALPILKNLFEQKKTLSISHPELFLNIIEKMVGVCSKIKNFLTISQKFAIRDMTQTPMNTLVNGCKNVHNAEEALKNNWHTIPNFNKNNFVCAMVLESMTTSSLATLYHEIFKGLESYLPAATSLAHLYHGEYGVNQGIKFQYEYDLLYRGDCVPDLVKQRQVIWNVYLEAMKTAECWSYSENVTNGLKLLFIGGKLQSTISRSNNVVEIHI